MLHGTAKPIQDKGFGRPVAAPPARQGPRFQPPIRVLPEEARPGIFAPPN
jgi:hypothetical protein